MTGTFIWNLVSKIFRFGMKSRSGNDYRAKDLNSYISLTHSVRCIVPPKIRGNEDEAEKLMALVDTSVNIECKAMGTPPPQINWLKNGLPLPLSSHIRLLSAGQVVRLDCIVCHFLSAYGNGHCQLFPHLRDFYKMLFPKVWLLLCRTVQYVFRRGKIRNEESTWLCILI